ncbi:MAG: hypothetical protein HN522_02805 [Flavobacteriales bacterium]|jgi:hypothetical protein|nr:hypothetical protein [Flavobacteriales bacterium]MBT5090762.1 hypothetical protein [Flavobacteriales bacterium]MBT5750744.1 hypothetical protein [Flavobacteriales bacterium]
MQKLSLLLSILILLFTSCEKSIRQNRVDENVINFVELNASQYTVNVLDSIVTGKFEKFSFSEGDTVTHENWDVAFSGTTIIVNGGDSYSVNQPERTANAAVYIATGIMSDIRTVDLTKLEQDNTSGPAIIDDLGISEQGWASYDMSSHILSPIPGKILVFRTHDNKYAKMEILYFYDTPNPIISDGDYGGFYTFNYVYQSTGEINF